MTPDCRNSASTVMSDAAISAPVWDDVARAPAFERPLFTTTIGFFFPTRRAIWENRRGFPNDSRSSRITSVASSPSQYRSRSFPEMSALFPTDTNVEIPSPSELAYSMIAKPSAPLCDEKPPRPDGGTLGANVASNRTLLSVFRMPMQFGPIRRIPYARHTRNNSRWLACPSAPISEKPAEITISALTPFRPQLSAAATTPFAGTTMMARSTAPGMFSTLVYAGTDSMTEADGLTG